MCRIRQVGGEEIEVVSPPQQVVEVKQVQDEVEMGCVAVNCCGVVCCVCLIHPELVVEGRLQVGYVHVVVVMVGVVD